MKILLTFSVPFMRHYDWCLCFITALAAGALLSTRTLLGTEEVCVATDCEALAGNWSGPLLSQSSERRSACIQEPCVCAEVLLVFLIYQYVNYVVHYSDAELKSK